MSTRGKLHALFGGAAPTRRWIAQVVGRAGAARIVALCALQSLMAINAVAFALAMRQTIDAAVAGDAHGFWLWCALFGGILCVQVACIAANRALLERTRSLFENQLRARALADVLDQPFEHAERAHSADLMTRMTSDATVVAEGAATLIPTGVSMGVRLVGVLAAMFVLVPQLTLAFLAAGCIAAAASVAVRPLLKRLHARMQQSEGDMRSYVQECLDSLLVVHAFGCEGKVRACADAAMRGYRRARLRKADASNACNAALVLAVQVGYVAGFAWCGFGILNGTCTYGTLMAVVQLIGQIQSPFSSLGGSFSKYSSMLASAERLMALGAKAGEGARLSHGASSAQGKSFADADEGFPALADAVSDGCKLAGRGRGESRFDAARFAELRLSDVAFSYDRGDAVLNGCDFHLHAGEFVGLAGASGAGKSTLTKLLLGAYAPQRGQAWAEDAEGARVALRDAKGLFAFVPQGNRLMAGTIRDVVAFSEHESEPDEERVVQACEAACAWDFIRHLPQGLDTVLGQRGSGLSEGQMQRLAVARAVYSEAPVLLLDEATSALDAQTEQRMLGNLRRLPGRSAVLVTHRPATLAACDRVVEVRDGACVQR